MRKIIYAFLVFLSMTGTIFAAKQTVNNGETLGQARTKINDNFTETYNLFGNFAGTSIGDIVRFVDAGVCSDTEYTTEATCEAATETWTSALGLPMTYDVKDLLDSENLLGGGGTWGSITGTLSDQTDLQSALDAITAGGINITTATPTTAGSANLNDTTHVLSVASSTGLTAFTGSFTAWDTAPTFAFTDVLDAELSTEYTGCAQIDNTNWPSPVTTAGLAAICTGDNVGCGTFGTAPGNVDPAGWVCAQHTSSASNSTVTDTEVTIGGVSDTFTSTTITSTISYLINEGFEGAGAPEGTAGWTSMIDAQGGSIDYDYAVTPGRDTQSVRIYGGAAAPGDATRISKTFTSDANNTFHTMIRFPDATPAAENIFLLLGSAGNVQITTGGYLRITPAGNSGLSDATTQLSDNVWYHLWATWSKDTQTISIWLSPNGTKPGTPLLTRTGTATVASESMTLQSVGPSYVDFDYVLADDAEIGSL